MSVIGIDLGTTNSVAAVYQHGQPRSLIIDGKYYVPSVVSFKNRQERFVGNQAKSRLLVDPENTVSSAKRYMGNRSQNWRIFDVNYSPVDIAAFVLRRLVDGAKDALGEDITEAVITVPAYFDDDQRADTKRAGERAGLNVLRLLPEPTAAAISYGFEQGKDQKLMVYDLGGGTFDISILEVQGNDFNVIAVGGDTRLGGDDFDWKIVEWIGKAYEHRYGIDIINRQGRDYAIAKQRMKEAAEHAKIELSDTDVAEINLPELVGHSLELQLHIDEFNEMIRPLLNKTIEGMRQVLRDAKLTADDIDRVILVGGSTRVPEVRKIVTREIKDPFSDVSPDEAVGWGAAIVAASLTAPEEDLAPIEIDFSDVTAHSLGIALLDHSLTKLIFVPIIVKNSHYPGKAGVIAWTVQPYQQAVTLKVYRGEDVDPQRDTYLGELTVKIKQPKFDSVPVVALFDLDKNGMLCFKAVDMPHGTSANQRILSFMEDAMRREWKIDVEAMDVLLRDKVLRDVEQVEIKTGITH